MPALTVQFVDIDVKPVLIFTIVSSVLIAESTHHIVDAQPVSMMMKSPLIVKYVHLNARPVSSKMDTQSVMNVLNSELTLLNVNVKTEDGITMESAINAVTHVPNVPTNGLVPNVPTSEPHLLNAHVQLDTMQKMIYQLVMPVLSDVSFVKEILTTVLNVLIPDSMLLFVTNVQKTSSTIWSMLIVNIALITTHIAYIVTKTFVKCVNQTESHQPVTVKLVILKLMTSVLDVITTV